MNFEKKYRDAKDEARLWKTMTRVCVGCLLVVVAVSLVEMERIKKEAAEVPAPENRVEVVTVEVEREQTYYNVPLSHFQQDIVRVIADHHGLDVRLPLAVMQQETQYQNLVGDDGCSLGYMQIQPKWHKARMERLGVSNLMEFYDNVLTGCDFLADLTEDYPLANALAFYNSGSAKLPNRYAESVLNIMEHLEVEQDG